MKVFSDALKPIELFNGIEESEFQLLMSCLSPAEIHYDKGQMVISAWEVIERFGIVLSGQVHVVQDDYFGSRSILAVIGPGQLFGESFACSKTEKPLISVIAAVESDILFIDCGKLSSPCSHACVFHRKLIQNMLSIVSVKNIAMTQKMEILSKRTTREKLLAYLSGAAKSAGSNRFRIGLNRQELADYLFVDRSAMSAELSKLRDDKILTFDKNEFELL